MVYAGDAADGLILAAESGTAGHRYLFTGENLTMEQLMGKIARVTKAPMPKTMPLPVTRALYAFQLLRYKFLSGPVPTISETAMAVMSAGQFLDTSLLFPWMWRSKERMLGSCRRVFYLLIDRTRNREFRHRCCGEESHSA